MINTHYVSWTMLNGMHFKVECQFDAACALFHILKSTKDVKEVSQGTTGK